MSEQCVSKSFKEDVKEKLLKQFETNSQNVQLMYM